MTDVRADFDVDTPQISVDTPIDHNFHQMANEKILRWESTLPPEYWEYRRQWEENPKNRVVGPFPIHLDVDITNDCNLKCIMCPRTDLVADGTYWPIAEFDFETYKRLIDEGMKNGLRSVKYNYISEPTMNRNLVEMIKYAKDAGVLDVMFNTNATLLTDRLCRQLIKSGLDKLLLSFDSPYREQFNRIRVGASYDKVLRNIRRFSAIREELGSVKPFTRVQMVRMKDNEGEWEDFRKLFEPIVDSVAYVDYLDHTGQTNPERTVIPVGSRKSKFCCPQLWQRMFVHVDGVVTVCCVDAMRELQVGNVFENTAQEIWQGEKYQRLRDLHASGRIDEIPTCARCPLSSY
jgi:radical SAM protein with 4Fe4S-binding SPASM domain